jgi:ADP-ribose pyrophosphatase
MRRSSWRSTTATSFSSSNIGCRSLERVSDGGGVAGEDIEVHRVRLEALAEFVAARREAGVAIDAKLLLLLGGGLLKP